LTEEEKQSDLSAPQDTTCWPELIAALGLIFGFCASPVLWTNAARTFPVCGLIQCSFSPAIDRISFALALVCSISFLFRKFKLISTVVLFASMLLLILLDLNRFQPWLYEYAIIILLCSLPENKSCLTQAECSRRKLQAVSILLISMYFFSGLEKLNWRFFTCIGPWLLGYSRSVLFSFDSNPGLIAASAMVAVAEIALAGALSFKRTRTVGICMGLFLHASILYILGPFGRHCNAAVWPWNLAQMLLLIVCFAKVPDQFILRFNIKERLWTGLILIVVSLIVPVLGLLQVADAYPAFAFYTGDVPCGKLMFEQSLLDQLPVYIRRNCLYDEAAKLWTLDLGDFAQAETDASVYESVFCLRKLGQQFAAAHPGQFVQLKLVTYPKLTRRTEIHYEKLGR
jgi:hypothetical protein